MLGFSDRALVLGELPSNYLQPLKDLFQYRYNMLLLGIADINPFTEIEKMFLTTTSDKGYAPLLQAELTLPEVNEYLDAEYPYIRGEAKYVRYNKLVLRLTEFRKIAPTSFKVFVIYKDYKIQRVAGNIYVHVNEDCSLKTVYFGERKQHGLEFILFDKGHQGPLIKEY